MRLEINDNKLFMHFRYDMVIKFAILRIVSLDPSEYFTLWGPQDWTRCQKENTDAFLHKNKNCADIILDVTSLNR